MVISIIIDPVGRTVRFAIFMAPGAVFLGLGWAR
jgi:hypothetical protein